MKTVTFTMAAADRNGVSVSQTSTGGTDLTITGALATGGVAYFTTPRHASIYSAADVSGVTFTVAGTDRFGNAITDAIAGPDTTPDTNTGVKNFATITQVALSGALSNAVEVGSANKAETQWIPLNQDTAVGTAQIKYSTSGALNFDLQATSDDVQAAGFQENDAVVNSLATGNASTRTTDAGYAAAVRVGITSHTAEGFTVTLMQPRP